MRFIFQPTQKSTFQSIAVNVYCEMFYVYILKCNDGKFYTGYTANLRARLERHSSGTVPATKYKLPVELKFYCAFADQYSANQFEKYLKSGSGRAFALKRLVKR